MTSNRRQMIRPLTVAVTLLWLMMPASVGAGPIHDAIREGDAATVEAIIRRDAGSRESRDDGRTPLILAAEKGQDTIVAVLLKAGADKMSRLEPTGETALHAATYWGHLKIAERLLDAGIPTDVPNHSGDTALHFAAMGAQRTASVEAGGSIRYSYKDNAEVVRLLLARGANPRLSDQKGNTPLHLAAKYDRAAVVALLLEAKVPVDAKTNDRWTPLHYAGSRHSRLVWEKEPNSKTTTRFAYYDNVEFARLLVRAGADVNAITTQGLTPLMVASEQGSEEVVRLLLEAKADVNKRALDGRTALHGAVQDGPLLEVTTREEGGTKITNLAVAAQKNVPIMVALLKVGADPGLKNAEGQTPIDVARKENRGIYVTVLQSYMSCGKVSGAPVAPACVDLAKFYFDLGFGWRSAKNYLPAITAYSEAIRLNPQHGDAHNNLAGIYEEQRRYDEAEELYKRALALREKTPGASSLEFAQTLANLGKVYDMQSRYNESEALYRRVLPTFERVLGRTHPEVAAILTSLGLACNGQRKDVEAERFLKRALTIRESRLGTGDEAVARTLDGLAAVYDGQRQYEQAEGLYKRSLAIREKAAAAGGSRFDVARTLNNLAGSYKNRGRYPEAEALFARALAIMEEGGESTSVVAILGNLADLYRRQSRHVEATAALKRALAVHERISGKSDHGLGMISHQLAEIAQVQGNNIEAKELYERALAIVELTDGPNHLNVVAVLDHMAEFFGPLERTSEALAYSRKATRALLAHVAAASADAQETEIPGGRTEQRADYFRHHAAHLAAAARKGLEPATALGPEAFEIAQRAAQSSAAAALQQMVARFAPANPQLASLVRERQDLTARWRGRDKKLITELSQPADQQDRVHVVRLRQEISDIETRIAAINARLEREFPDYAALARPQPAMIKEMQELLAVDEALLFVLTGDTESHVFALSRESFEWRTVELGTRELEEKVAAFRRGLDVDELRHSIFAGKPRLFDLGLAHELYAALVGPIDAVVKDKPNLVVVPTGPLTSLPFHLLVTEKPVVAVPQLKDIAAYRDAAWLIKRHAVAVLPSVASLKALRVFARKDQGTKPMVGFGDPIFRPEQLVNISMRAAKSKTASRTRAYADYWQGKGIDRATLSEALPALPETAKELKAVAREVGAPAADIHLGKDASETTVKRTPLANYRIVYFATHGLVAGDVRGLGEPSLALSIPKEPSDLDDGLLTASEVAQLKLAADWVVLSACNTAAGDRPGAEALSGLARAFFYAGARALLVSHWAVDLEAATRLTTSTFRIMKSDAKAGRAEALQRAMLAYMMDTSDPLNSYPGIWGPFSVVGDGTIC